MDNQGKLIDQHRLPNDAMPDYVAQLPERPFYLDSPLTDVFIDVEKVLINFYDLGN